eukprot:m.67071 g.67071  ORF g.67071 m.67071 type:complete len:345 (+) comp12155_c0_seq4:66-1100(+)
MEVVICLPDIGFVQERDVIEEVVIPNIRKYARAASVNAAIHVFCPSQADSTPTYWLRARGIAENAQGPLQLVIVTGNTLGKDVLPAKLSEARFAKLDESVKEWYQLDRTTKNYILSVPDDKKDETDLSALASSAQVGAAIQHLISECVLSQGSLLYHWVHREIDPTELTAEVASKWCVTGDDGLPSQSAMERSHSVTAALKRRSGAAQQQRHTLSNLTDETAVLDYLDDMAAALTERLMAAVHEIIDERPPVAPTTIATSSILLKQNSFADKRQQMSPLRGEILAEIKEFFASTRGHWKIYSRNSSCQAISCSFTLHGCCVQVHWCIWRSITHDYPSTSSQYGD